MSGLVLHYQGGQAIPRDLASSFTPPNSPSPLKVPQIKMKSFQNNFRGSDQT